MATLLNSALNAGNSDDRKKRNRILTPPGVASFITLKKPRAITEGAEERYSISIIFDKAAQARPEFSALEQAVDRAAKTRWPNKLPSNLQSPFHDGAEKADQYDGYKPGYIYISPWSKRQPGCIDGNRQTVIDFDEYYAGYIVRANVSPFAYDTAGKRGVLLILESVQFLKPGPRIDGSLPAIDQFPDDGEGQDEIV